MLNDANNARRVVGIRLTHYTRAGNALDDVAGNIPKPKILNPKPICRSLARGGDVPRAPSDRAGGGGACQGRAVQVEPKKPRAESAPPFRA